MNLEEKVKKQLEELREEYKVATIDRRREIVRKAEELKDSIKRLCYECKNVEYTEEHLPFCSKICHKVWASYNYKGFERGRHQLKPEEMKERLLAMGKKQTLDEKTESSGQIRI